MNFRNENQIIKLMPMLHLILDELKKFVHNFI